MIRQKQTNTRAGTHTHTHIHARVYTGVSVHKHKHMHIIVHNCLVHHPPSLATFPLLLCKIRKTATITQKHHKTIAASCASHLSPSYFPSSPHPPTHLFLSNSPLMPSCSAQCCQSLPKCCLPC